MMREKSNSIVNTIQFGDKKEHNVVIVVVIMLKESVRNENYDGDDDDNDYVIYGDGDIESVYNFFCQRNCIQNPCKNNATCQSRFTEKGYRFL